VNKQQAASNKVAFTDIETTGLLDPEGEERIIEVAVIQHDLDTGALIREFVWRSNPMRKIGIKAFKVHGISLDDLAKEPTFDLIAPAIRGSIEPCVLAVAHNGDFFDFPFLQRELTRCGQRMTVPKTYDTMVQARWATGNGKNPKLAELALCLDIEYNPKEAHGALYDTRVLAACFFEAKRIGWVKI
jgi:DNA polymerase III subunit epsilon